MWTLVLEEMFTPIYFFVKLLYFDTNITQRSFWGPNQQKSVGSYTSLAPNRRQAIISSNDALVYWRLYA